MKYIIYILLMVFVFSGQVEAGEGKVPNFIEFLRNTPKDMWLSSADGFFSKPIRLKENIHEVKGLLDECDSAIDSDMQSSWNRSEPRKGELREMKSMILQFRGLYQAEIDPIEKLAADKEKVRIDGLKSGKVKLDSIQDADKIIPGGNLFNLAGSPLLNADGKMYKGRVRIDVQEGKFIRVLSEIMEIQERRYPRYVYLKVVKTTQNFSPEGLRIGATIGVIGKYIGNINYTTVGGETKTAPILEVAFLGN